MATLTRKRSGENIYEITPYTSGNVSATGAVKGWNVEGLWYTLAPGGGTCSPPATEPAGSDCGQCVNRDGWAAC